MLPGVFCSYFRAAFVPLSLWMLMMFKVTICHPDDPNAWRVKLTAVIHTTSFFND